ncbi:hypothetical protein JOB18_012581 [Solea senegalensis]|uniref:Ig-like domain-containing protein n=1 Tax=Solea senegalensis TaxID=28829 RepID=A0AAV6RTQ6_SOLSE|nr:uncharacterized protein LOC122783829 [Solea senegalensis]KAG7508404.1 hypothetical protein JOB18_012581 [Solea senegalensis]
MAPTSRNILFLVALLHVTGIDATVDGSRVFVKAGDTVTLSCGDVKSTVNRCGGTTWLFSRGNTSTQALFEKNQYHKDASSKCNRLNVLSNCSLVIKTVAVGDDGFYFCRWFNTSGTQEGGVWTELSVVSNWWWLYILVAVVVVAAVALCCIVVFVVMKWKRTKGNKTQTNVDDSDPEDGVAYASISFTQKNSANAQALRKHKDDDATYSVVQLSTS